MVKFERLACQNSFGFLTNGKLYKGSVLLATFILIEGQLRHRLHSF